MSKISPCLWFTNQAAEAANFYVSLLPELAHRPRDAQHGGPAVRPGGVGSAGVIHPGRSGLPGAERWRAAGPHASISFSIDCADQAEVDRLWDRLSDGGTPVQCGWVKDRYGISWQVVPSMLPKLLNDPDTKKTQRVMQAMLRMIKLDIAALQAAYDEVSS